MRLPGNAVPETELPAEDTVRRVHGLAVHERAAAHDRLDPMLPASLQRLSRHAARPESPTEASGAHLRRIPGLCAPYDPAATPPRSRARAHGPCRARQAPGDPDGRCPPPHDRWAGGCSLPLHAARARCGAAPPAAPAPLAGAAIAAAVRPNSLPGGRNVVQTFGGAALEYQGLSRVCQDQSTVERTSTLVFTGQSPRTPVQEREGAAGGPIADIDNLCHHRYSDVDNTQKG